MNGGDRGKQLGDSKNLPPSSASQHAAERSQNGSAGSALAPRQADEATAACQGPGLLNDQRPRPLLHPPTPLWLRGRSSLLDAGPEVCVAVHARMKNVCWSLLEFCFSLERPRLQFDNSLIK